MCFEHVNLFGYEQEGRLVGFMGISAENLEMLFIDNRVRARGIGKKLLVYGITQFNIAKVDVNEQNLQGIGFYKHMGFRVLKRSEQDGQGKAYPVLHMGL